MSSVDVTTKVASFILAMFLISPAARGEFLTSAQWGELTTESAGLGQWQSQMHKDCVQNYTNAFMQWSRLDSNGGLLAEKLCSQDRVYWPFVEARDPELHEVTLNSRQEARATPFILGLIGTNARVNSEVMQAIRSSLNPSSLALYRWEGNDDPEDFARWRQDPNGGLLGGVIYVTIDGPTVEKIDEQVRRARRAMAFVGDSANGLGSTYTLIIDSRQGHPELIAGADELPVVDDWIPVAAPEWGECQVRLAL